MFVREQLVLYTFLESQFQISFVFFFVDIAGITLYQKKFT